MFTIECTYIQNYDTVTKVIRIFTDLGRAEREFATLALNQTLYPQAEHPMLVDLNERVVTNPFQQLISYSLYEYDETYQTKNRLKTYSFKNTNF